MVAVPPVGCCRLLPSSLWVVPLLIFLERVSTRDAFTRKVALSWAPTFWLRFAPRLRAPTSPRVPTLEFLLFLGYLPHFSFFSFFFFFCTFFSLHFFMFSLILFLNFFRIIFSCFCFFSRVTTSPPRLSPPLLSQKLKLPNSKPVSAAACAINNLAACQGEKDTPSLIDVKGLGRPKEFTCTEGDFQQWSKKTGAVFAGVI